MPLNNRFGIGSGGFMGIKTSVIHCKLILLPDVSDNKVTYKPQTYEEDITNPRSWLKTDINMKEL